jgi:hypothetical protein
MAGYAPFHGTACSALKQRTSILQIICAGRDLRSVKQNQAFLKNTWSSEID